MSFIFACRRRNKNLFRKFRTLGSSRHHKLHEKKFTFEKPVFAAAWRHRVQGINDERNRRKTKSPCASNESDARSRGNQTNNSINNEDKAKHKQTKTSGKN